MQQASTLVEKVQPEAFFASLKVSKDDVSFRDHQWGKKALPFGQGARSW
jgi:hypothetical protein